MKYFISYVYLTRRGMFLYGNDIIEINSEITTQLISEIEKQYELKQDARTERLKILYITRL
jgi:hypothetical protein